jgi:hypothetical protein
MIADTLLHALAAGALDPGTSLGLRQAIAARPTLRRRWDEIRTAARMPDLRRQGDHALPSALTRGDAPDRVVLRLAAPAAPARHLVVLRVLEPFGPRLLHPADPRDVRTLAAFPTSDGHIELDLVLPEHPLQVALLPLDHALTADAVDATIRARAVPTWIVDPTEAT